MAFNVIMRRRSFAGSNIGGITETQEMLVFCAAHNISNEIAIIQESQTGMNPPTGGWLFHLAASCILAKGAAHQNICRMLINAYQKVQRTEIFLKIMT